MPFWRVRRVDDATSIVPVSRDQFRLLENDHTLLFSAELVTGEPARHIYAKSIRAWLPPNEFETITPERREELLSKICTYFRINGEATKVVP